jgi:hypothetical protein
MTEEDELKQNLLDPNRRNGTIESLCDLAANYPSLADTLMHLLIHESSNVPMQKIAEILGRMGPRNEQDIAALCYSQRADLRECGAIGLQMLSNLSPTGIAALVAVLRDSTLPVWCRACEAVAKFKLGGMPPFIGSLLDAIEDSNMQVRRFGAYALQHSETLPPSAIESLTSALRGRSGADSVTECSLIASLGKIRPIHERVIHELMELVRNSSDHEDDIERITAVAEVVHSVGPSAKPVVADLRKRWRHHDDGLRLSIADAIIAASPTDCDDAIDAVLSVLDSTNELDRATALVILANVSSLSQSALEELKRHLLDEDANVRSLIEKAVSHFDQFAAKH